MNGCTCTAHFAVDPAEHDDDCAGLGNAEEGMQAMTVSFPDPATAPPWHQRLYAPDTSEVAQWLQATSEANRRYWVERTQRQVETAHDCLIRGHEMQIYTLRNQLKKERERVAWLERNYGDPL